MRIAQLLVLDYKNVQATLPWAPAIVLFGPNDAGKSNILEAVGASTGTRRDRTDARFDDDPRYAMTQLRELAALDDDASFDGRRLAHVLQLQHLPPLFPSFG